jgi:hypothetical protein
LGMRLKSLIGAGSDVLVKNPKRLILNIVWCIQWALEHYIHNRMVKPHNTNSFTHSKKFCL